MIKGLLGQSYPRIFFLPMYICVFLEKLKKGTISIKFRYKNFKEPKKLKKKPEMNV